MLAGVQPVQPVALVERGVEHREAGAGVEHPPGIDTVQQFAVDRGFRHSEVDADDHRDRENGVLPKDPAPIEMVEIPAFQRGGNVEREFEVQPIGRDAERPEFLRQALQDEADRQRNERAAAQSGDHLEDQQRSEIERERQQQRGDEEHRG
jgi:hypothetical protein